MIAKLAPFVVTVVLFGVVGCGSSNDDDNSPPPRQSDIVDPAITPYVNSLEVEPDGRTFLLTTNKGFFSIDKESSKVTPIKGRITADGKSDTVGTFLEIEPDGQGKLLGSGHPDNQNTLPQFLGYIESDDDGKTWRSVSRLGDADLHKILIAHGKMYAFDAVLGAMLISDDGGRTFEERFTPRSLIIDFVVDPEDENFLLASTEEQIYRTDDQGERWRPLTDGSAPRLAWPAPGQLYRADKDGTVMMSTDKGDTFAPVGKVDGEPYKFETTDDPQHLFLAMADGAIQESTDAGKTWKAVFTP